MMNIIEQITNLLKLNKNKAYEACPFFSGGLMFVHQEVRACCSYKCGLFFEKNYDGGKIDWKKVEKQRKEVKELICGIAAAVGFGVTVALLNKDVIKEKLLKIFTKNNTTKKA